MAPLLGPDPEEYADFEEASRPHDLTLTVRGILRVYGTLAILALLLSAGVIAGLVYQANQPRNLILGSWVAVDHPTIRSLDFDKSGTVHIVWKDQPSALFYYRFSSRRTVSVFGTPHEDWDNRGQFRVTFGQQALTMTTENRDNKETYRWQRQR